VNDTFAGAFMIAYLWVAIGGALGSVARYWLNGIISNRVPETFPWGTLAVNVTGSFIIGVLGALAAPEGKLTPQTRIFAIQFLMYGVCGGYTTFSSFSWQTLQRLQDRQWLAAGGNIFLSVALCLVAVSLGYWLGSIVNSMKGN
jgi:fluoride exporter